jgi:hypothetical protein
MEHWEFNEETGRWEPVTIPIRHPIHLLFGCVALALLIRGLAALIL